MPWTLVPANPPLANPSAFTGMLPNPDYIAPCDPPVGCEIQHVWYGWTEEAMCMIGIPWTTAPPCMGAWIVEGGQPPTSAWTGFFGCLNGGGAPRSYSLGGTVLPPTSVGARVLGQSVDDRFGTAVGTDGRWLYISSPEHTALRNDVPSLPANRTASGVVYQLRTDVRTGPGEPNMAQLWVEPNAVWPEVDAEIPTRVDYTMPTPHQYIIETIGSIRGRYEYETFPKSPYPACIEGYPYYDVSDAEEIYRYLPYPTATSGYYTDTTPQIVGPHAEARISYVRGLGDVDGDGIRDFAVGSKDIKDPANPVNVVGAIYVIYGRGTGLEGDYLLENLHLEPGDPKRLKGVMLKGSSRDETLARVFDSAGDFNGDGYDDVIVGNEAAAGGGEAIVILGSQFLESPANGWTVDGIVAAGHALRFGAAADGDLVGANVAGAGDVDGDGFDDILIAAPGANGGQGTVYLIYGSRKLSGQVDLAQVGSVDVPGARFIGRKVGDQVGGGSKLIAGTMPGKPSYSFPAYSRGVAPLGDIDGDGNDDYAISAMLADANGRVDSGEVYILYGRGD